MWWNHAGWGPMYGWWIMPVFGLLFMLIFIFFISRIFNRNGGGCGPFGQGTSRNIEEENELLDKIKALRREVDELRKNQKEGRWQDAGRVKKAEKITESKCEK